VAVRSGGGSVGGSGGGIDGDSGGGSRGGSGVLNDSGLTNRQQVGGVLIVDTRMTASAVRLRYSWRQR
jgi:hypothetical protein